MSRFRLPSFVPSAFRNFKFSTLWLAGYDADAAVAESTTSQASQSEPAKSRPASIGGQAVIEGVMMRSPKRLAVAVRAPDGQIVVDNREFIPYSRRHRVLSLPVLRGAASLIESLVIGLQALNFSVAVQEQGAGAAKTDKAAASTLAAKSEPTSQVPVAAAFHKPASGKDKLLIAGSLVVSFLLAMALFQFLPYFVSGNIVGGSKVSSPNPLLFNTVAGAVRMSLLLCYLWAISRMPDVARVFEYHGAEHKSIFAFEHGQALTSDNAARETRFHPRCGTSFILIVALVCICFFSVFDALVLQMGFHYPTFFHRFLAHLPFIPVVAGLAFEVLKLSARFQDSVFVRPLILPGLLLQRITTREPDAKKLDVAIASIQASLA